MAEAEPYTVYGGNKSRFSVSYLGAQPFALIEGAAMACERAL
jgi:hypothetical protein